MNYVNIITLLDNFSNIHIDVKRFKSDTLDKLSDTSNMSESFPLLYAVPINQKVSKNVNQYKSNEFIFDIYCLVPKIYLETEEDDVVLLNQTNNNLNQTQKILSDLYYYFEDTEGLEFLQDVNLTPVNNYTSDVLQGWYGRFYFSTDVEECEIENAVDVNNGELPIRITR